MAVCVWMYRGVAARQISWICLIVAVDVVDGYGGWEWYSGFPGSPSVAGAAGRRYSVGGERLSHPGLVWYLVVDSWARTELSWGCPHGVICICDWQGAP